MVSNSCLSEVSAEVPGLKVYATTPDFSVDIIYMDKFSIINYGSSAPWDDCYSIDKSNKAIYFCKRMIHNIKMH